MRSSLALPSHLFRYQIPGLSDVGHFLISSRLFRINALWHASCGSAHYEPLQSAYDLFANVISWGRTLDEELIGTTIPSLVAETAEEHGWLRFSTPLKRPLEPWLLERIKDLARRPIARWTSTISRTVRSIPSFRSAPTTIEINLGDLPLNVNGEPRDIDARPSYRKAAIITYKKQWRTNKRITDPDIARECGWGDRTPIARFKRCDPRNTKGVDNRIWRVLRSTPRFCMSGDTSKK